MKTGEVVQAWGLILSGYHPNLSIEITRECPLRCPGCYAYGDEHLGGGLVLRELADYKGQELIDGVLAVVEREKPVHLSLVGGEPLVRFRELDVLLPKLTGMGIHTQVVTSAVRPIPESWAGMPRLQVCVSIDGLAPEHDVRRAPATYERILKHIEGQQITVHCTITRQQTRPGYVTEFTEFWAANPDVKRIWFSLYTPQRGEDSPEMLRLEDRQRVVAELTELYEKHPKLEDMRPSVTRGYLAPPQDPDECIFAKTTA
ncbi:MAG TPA: radical SAM protein, partial [Vicinamibacterales bacterium]|nr:radical SAM protein [Vicinamibacterales bacterium]